MTITAPQPGEDSSLRLLTEAAHLSTRKLASLNVGDQFVLTPEPGSDVLTVAITHLHPATPQPYVTIETTSGQKFNSDAAHLGHPSLRETLAPDVHLLRTAA